MVAVAFKEIVPDLIVHCDPAQLIQQGGCKTTAIAGKDVQGPHYFLILSVSSEGECLCIPLYSEKERGFTNDWEMLVPGAKSGKAELWTDCDSYFFKWQFWKVPRTSFETASRTDDSSSTNRRRYGENDASLLSAIQGYLSRAKQPWRSL